VHPSGIKFGLSRDLLQLRGADVVVSDRFFELMSDVARRRIRTNNRLSAVDLWDEVVHFGLGSLLPQFSAPHSESVPFFMGLDRVVYITLMPLAERMRLGRRIGKDFLFGNEFNSEFDNRIKKLELSRDMMQSRRLLFRACCNAVSSLCRQYSPDDLRHADLLALYAFHKWSAAGCLEITVFLRTARPRGDDLSNDRAFRLWQALYKNPRPFLQGS
jgi:hypothetical protein